MDETGSILVVFGIFAGIFALAIAGLKAKDRLSRPQNAGRISAEPGQLRVAVLVGALLLLVPLVLWVRRSFTPWALLAVVVPFAIAVMFWASRKRREVQILMESVVGEFGWSEGPIEQKRRFTVLPDENVVRQWRGRRVGLAILDPPPRSRSFGKLRYSVEVPSAGTLEIRAAYRPDPAAPRPLQTRGDRLDLDATLREQYSRELANLLSNAGDQLSLKGSRLVIDLILNVRAIPSEGPEPKLLPAYEPLRPDLRSLELLLRATWPDVQSLLGAFSAG